MILIKTDMLEKIKNPDFMALPMLLRKTDILEKVQHPGFHGPANAFAKKKYFGKRQNTRI